MTHGSSSHHTNGGAGSGFDYYGLKDLSFLCDRRVKELFPIPKSPKKTTTTTNEFCESGNNDGNGKFLSRRASTARKRLSTVSTSSAGHSACEDTKELPEIKEWIAYMLYRTGLSEANILFAIHLLQRWSKMCYTTTGEFVFPNESIDAPPPCVYLLPEMPSFHHAWLVVALILSTTYFMDDSFQLSSWSIACKKVFTVPELTKMELDCFALLGWRLRLEGERLPIILEKMELEWKQELMMTELKEKEAAGARKRLEERKVKESRRRSAPPPQQRQLSPSSHSGPSNQRSGGFGQMLGSIFSNWHAHQHHQTQSLSLSRVSTLSTLASSRSGHSGFHSILSPACSRTSVPRARAAA